jgi:all-trans-retinol 13,14-reductase
MVEKHGGQLRHGPGGDVREVLLEGRWRPRAVGVRCADGTEVRAPVVVSSVGLPQTVGGLVPADAFPRRVRRAVRRHVSLPSNLMLRIGFGQGCDRALVEQAIGFATTFRWMEQGAWDMDQDPTAEDWVPDDVLVMFPEFYQAPPGSAAMQTCEVVFVTDHRFFRHWTDAKDPAYLAVIDRIAGKLRAFFDAKFPTLAPHVACSWMSHPLEIRDRIHHEGGSIYGLDSYKLIDQDILPRSGIPGLFLTGEDVVAHGVSISAGMTTAGVVLSGDIALGLLRWIGRTLLRSPLLALRMILPLGSTYRLPQHLMDEAHPRGRR